MLARKPGGLGTQDGRSRELERRRHQEDDLAEKSPATKQIWIRFGGKTRPMEVEAEKIGRLEEAIRECMALGDETQIYMVSEGRRVDGRNLAGMEEEKVVDVRLMMKGGGKKKKRVKNPLGFSESEVEKSETDKTGGRCWMMC